MDDIGPLAAPAVSMVVGGVYAFLEGGRVQLRRLICVDAVNDEFVFKNVSTKWDRTQKNAVAVSRSKTKKLVEKGKVMAEPDYVRPSFMAEDDQGLKQRSPKTVKGRGDKDLTDEERAERVADWLAKRDRDFDVIAPLVGVAGQPDREHLLLLAYSPRHCSKRVAAFARESGLDLTAVKRLLHKYAWFGLDRNALLQLDSFRGRSGLLTRRNVERPGPVDSAVRFHGEKFQNRPRAKRDLAPILMAIQEYWVKRHMTLTATYKCMKEDYYEQKNQHGSTPIQGKLIPTQRMFEYAARILIKRLGLRALREGHKGGKELGERRGYDTDISPNVAEVFDIDGTPFNSLIGKLPQVAHLASHLAHSLCGIHSGSPGHGLQHHPIPARHVAA